MTTLCVPLATVATSDGSLDRRCTTVVLMRHDYYDPSGTWLSANIVDPYPIDTIESQDKDFVPVLDIWRPSSQGDFLGWVNEWLDVDLPDMRSSNARTGLTTTVRRSVRFVAIDPRLITARRGMPINPGGTNHPKSTLLARTLEHENILHVAARSGASPDALVAMANGRFINSVAMFGTLARATRASIKDVVSDLTDNAPDAVIFGSGHE